MKSCLKVLGGGVMVVLCLAIVQGGFIPAFVDWIHVQMAKFGLGEHLRWVNTFTVCFVLGSIIMTTLTYLGIGGGGSAKLAGPPDSTTTSSTNPMSSRRTNSGGVIGMKDIGGDSDGDGGD